MFFYEFYEIIKKTCFVENIRMAASVQKTLIEWSLDVIQYNKQVSFTSNLLLWIEYYRLAVLFKYFESQIYCVAQIVEEMGFETTGTSRKAVKFPCWKILKTYFSLGILVIKSREN